MHARRIHYSMVHFLAYMSTRKDFPVYYSALPVLGRDGTLWNIHVNSSAAGGSGRDHARRRASVGRDRRGGVRRGAVTTLGAARRPPRA